jgi:hypothetical protein
MVSGRAVSKSGTLAWINTLLILTGQCGGTLWISQTLVLLATNVGIWVRPVASWTRAHCSMILGRTDGIDATSFQWTGVHTLTIDAGLSEWAL